jgi:HAD superfamily hydrolase (TIGR01458 family)
MPPYGARLGPGTWKNQGLHYIFAAPVPPPLPSAAWAGPGMKFRRSKQLMRRGKMNRFHERPRVQGILLDIEGVVCVGDKVLAGSLQAINRIQRLGIPLRLITNTTRRPRRQIANDLARLGLDFRTEDIFTPAISARAHLRHHNLTPFLLVHPDLREDFAGLGAGGGEAVVVGDAGSCFTYELLNAAYRKIIHGAEFLALAKNRNFLDSDFELSLDAGPFVVALEYASGRVATVFGKPAPSLF